MVPHPGVPLIERLDIDEGHFPIGSSHDAIVFTADDKVDVLSKFPPAVTAKKARFVLLRSAALDGPPQIAQARCVLQCGHTPPELTYR